MTFDIISGHRKRRTIHGGTKFYLDLDLLDYSYTLNEKGQQTQMITGKRLWPMIVSIVTIFVIGFVLLSKGDISIKAGNTKKVHFSGYDVLAHNGEEITLKAKIETKYRRKDIKNEPVNFYVDGKFVGNSETNRDGYAMLNYTPNKIGNFEIVYRLSDSSRYTPRKTTGLLFVKTDEKPILVSDLDDTILDIHSYQLLDHDPSEIPPMKNAPQVLKKLAERYDIIYLTARNDIYLNPTKEWLAYYNLPKAPVFFSSKAEDLIDQGKFKKNWLRRLKERWPNLAIGIGNKVHDAEAYVANGMIAYIIGESQDNLPAHAFAVKDWDEIYSILLKH